MMSTQKSLENPFAKISHSLQRSEGEHDGNKQMNTSKSIDIPFICTSIIFIASVSVLYFVTKLGNMMLVQMCGVIFLSLIISVRYQYCFGFRQIKYIVVATKMAVAIPRIIATVRVFSSSLPSPWKEV